MRIFKVALVMAAGLGSTWVARATTDALLGTSAFSTVRTAAPAAEKPPEVNAQRGDAPVAEGSRAETDPGLSRGRAATSSGPARETEMREFRPSKPLSADVSISLPSDI